MRRHSIALLTLIATFAGSTPAGAASSSSALEPGPYSVLCHRLNTARQYAKSLAACTIARDGYKSAGGDWYPYYMQADALEMMAIDNAWLKHHHLALEQALQSHRLALYAYRGFHLDQSSDDGPTVAGLINQLVALEKRETAFIKAGVGD